MLLWSDFTIMESYIRTLLCILNFCKPKIDAAVHLMEYCMEMKFKSAYLQTKLEKWVPEI